MLAGDRRRSVKPSWLIGAAVVAGLIAAEPASATMVVTCSKSADPGPLTVTLSGDGGPVTSGRVQLILNPAGTAVEVRDLSNSGNVLITCSGGFSMAPAQITQIDVTEPVVQAGSAGTRFEVSELNGRFEQSAGGNEIDINLDLGGDGGTDSLEVNPRLGTADVYRAGDIDGGPPVRVGLNVNNDDDVDIFAVSPLSSFLSVAADYANESNDDTVTFDGTGGVGQGNYIGGAVASTSNASAAGGTDTLVAGSGGGGVDGGEGTDTITGGAGNDTFGVGLGNDSASDPSSSDSDFASYGGVATPVNVDLSILGSQDTGGGGTDSLTNVEGVGGGTAADVLRGNSLDNVITDGDFLTSSADTLIGGAGNDGMFAGQGDDLLVGGAGNDQLSDGPGTDTISYLQGSSGPVTIDMSINFVDQNTGGSGIENLFDTGFENLISSPFGDTITGNALPNTIDVRDGVSDTVTCLGGGDVVIADPEGLDVIGADCETKTFLPPTGGGGGGGGDTTAPETTISKQPKKKSTKTKAKFKFTSNEPGSTFTCKLDKKKTKPCSSPQAYKKLKAKKHKFSVFATDPAGNADGSPAKAKFKVVAP